MQPKGKKIIILELIFSTDDLMVHYYRENNINLKLWMSKRSFIVFLFAVNLLHNTPSYLAMVQYPDFIIEIISCIFN